MYSTREKNKNIEILSKAKEDLRIDVRSCHGARNVDVDLTDDVSHPDTNKQCATILNMTIANDNLQLILCQSRKRYQHPLLKISCLSYILFCSVTDADCLDVNNPSGNDFVMAQSVLTRLVCIVSLTGIFFISAQYGYLDALQAITRTSQSSPKQLFIQNALDHDISGPYNGSYLQDLCLQTKWRPGLIFSCGRIYGGIGNVSSI